MTRGLVLIAGLALPAAVLAAPAREERPIMGTTAEIQAGGLPDPRPALEAGFAALLRVDDAMSPRKPSELTRLNDSGGGAVSPDLYFVLECAFAVARASDGAFDPTMEPLVRAMGSPGGPPHSLTGRDRRRMLTRIGYRRVSLEPEGRTVTLGGTRVDLDGVATGYAVDLALAALRAAGATQGLVDFGGRRLGVFGLSLDAAVRDPERADGDPWARFSLAEGTLGTSGGDPKASDHILDPRTGEPAHEVLGATVIAPSAMEADALSAAAFVLGPKRGLALLAERGASGFVLVRERGRRIIWTTGGFPDASRLRAAPGVHIREEP